MTSVCAVPRCSNPGTLYMQDVAKACWWFCAPCAERHAAIVERNGARGYVPVDESDAAAQLPLGA